MKEWLIMVAKIVTIILAYGAMFWLAVNPVLEYLGMKEMELSQSIALLSLVVISILFIKQL